MKENKDNLAESKEQNLNKKENESEVIKKNNEGEKNSEENKNLELTSQISIEKFSEDIETIFISMNLTWESDRESYLGYFQADINPKINQFLSYSCLDSNQEKIKLIYQFICRYYLERTKYLDEIPKEELKFMLTILKGNFNIFSINSNANNLNVSESIYDKYFNAIFKELLPDKEIGIISGKNTKNSMYKYLLEFVFQCGFIENYIEKALTRNDILPNDFIDLYFYLGDFLYILDKNYIKNKELVLKIVKSTNRIIDYFLSEGNQILKNDAMINSLLTLLPKDFFEQTLLIFNSDFDGIMANNLQEYQIYCINFFKLNIYFLKHQKINNRFLAMKNISNLCEIYLDFLKKKNTYVNYIKKYENAEKIVELLIKVGTDYLDKNNIFDMIFGDNIHEGTIQRSYETLSLLYKYNRFNSKHIQTLWNLSQTKPMIISNNIIIIFGKLLPEFSLEDCNSILKIVDNMPFNKINDITLKLLENFFRINTRRELLLNILYKFSNELSYEQGLNKNLILKSRDILVELLLNSNYAQDLVIFIKKSIFYIHKFYLVDTYSSILELILEKLSEKNNFININFAVPIKNFSELISYLDEEYKLFPIYMNYFVKIIQLFKFFCGVSIKILNEIYIGNFDFESLFNADNLYFEYIVFIQTNMNFQYNNYENDMNIETNNNNDNFCLETEFNSEIKDTEQENYIKNLIKQYIIYLKGLVTTNDNLPSSEELLIIIFKMLKIDFQELSFHDFITKIIQALLLNYLRAGINFKYDYLKFLYTIAQNTSDIDPTLSWYYKLLKAIFSVRIEQNNINMIDDITMKKIISEQILNCNYELTNKSIFKTLLQYVIFINQKNGNAVYSTLLNKFTEIKNIKDFLYFDIIWEFYTKALDEDVSNEFYEVIINILELTSKNEQNRNELINKIFNFIQNNKNNIKNNPQIKLIFLRTLKVISIILGRKSNNDNNEINIINKEEEYIPTENELKEGYSVIKLIFGEKIYFGEDIMKEAIIHFKGNIDKAGLYLTVPDNVKTLRKKMQNKNKKSNIKTTKDGIVCLEEEKIDLLIEILNNNIYIEINEQIWELFSSIKYSDNIMQKIFGEDFDKIFNNKNGNKFILYLEIINSLIFNSDFCKYNKLTKEAKNTWISNFLKNKNLIKNIFTLLNSLEIEQYNEFFLYKYLNIFISWLHKIIIKICEKIESKNDNQKSIMTEIVVLREKNKINDINLIDNSEGNNNEFEIVNNNDALEFLNALNETNGELIFYNMLNMILRVNSIKDKIILIQKTSEFLIISLMLQKENIPKICSEEKNSKILILILTRFEGPLERLFVNNLLKILIRNLTSSTNENNFFNIIFESLVSEINSGVNMNDEFCDFFSYLLVVSSNDYVKKLLDPLIHKFLIEIITLISNTDKYDEIKHDKISHISYFLFKSFLFNDDIIVKNINQIYDEQKIDFIECLYDYLLTISKDDIEKMNYDKLIDPSIKEYLFNILGLVTLKHKDYFVKILNKMMNVYKNSDKKTQNKIETPFDENINLRSKEHKLIGLRNFGCTCYLNSLLQQLYMMPSFKKDLFNNFIFPENINYHEDLTYSVIYNLQLTFQNLKNGSMDPYPPLRFIRSIKSAFNGEPIQLHAQQDSDEFLSILCENLEKEAKKNNKELFLENSIKGKISNQIISLEKDYPHYSETEEPFYRITLDIKGHKNLEDALDAYVKGEILEGDNKYYIDKYKTKISIRKNNSLKILGNVVIIHLKRFEYDFYTFTNYKLHDYLKFPSKINFKKWTRDYLSSNYNIENNNDSFNITEEKKLNLIDDNMDYILTGVLVHSGYNLQSGHYFSYIMDQETGKWYKFNDSMVTDYNINNLENDCYGNNNEGNTAYLLFYTKKNIFRNKNILENINVNKTILDDAYNENIKFLNTHIYLNNNYFSFIINLCKSGIELLKDEKLLFNAENLTLNNFLIKNNYIYKKILSIIKPNYNEDSSDKNIDESNICNTENFEEIYNKCLEEVNNLMIIEKEENKKINNKKNLIKLYFNYLFEVLLPYYKVNQNKNLMIVSFQTLVEIIKNNMDYSFYIAKQIEKHIDSFTELIKKSSLIENEYSEVSLLVFQFFQLIFSHIYIHESNNMKMTSDIIKYFMKDDQGKYIIVKEYKSITIRLIKKLFCDNIDKTKNLDLDKIFFDNTAEIQNIRDLNLNEIFFGNEKDKKMINQIYSNENIAQKIIIFNQNLFLTNDNRFFNEVSKIINTK